MGHPGAKGGTGGSCHRCCGTILPSVSPSSLCCSHDVWGLQDSLDTWRQARVRMHARVGLPFVPKEPAAHLVWVCPTRYLDPCRLLLLGQCGLWCPQCTRGTTHQPWPLLRSEPSGCCSSLSGPLGTQAHERVCVSPSRGETAGTAWLEHVDRALASCPAGSSLTI